MVLTPPPPSPSAAPSIVSSNLLSESSSLGGRKPYGSVFSNVLKARPVITWSSYPLRILWWYRREKKGYEDTGELDLFRNSSLEQIPSALSGTQQFSSQESAEAAPSTWKHFTNILAVQLSGVRIANTSPHTDETHHVSLFSKTPCESVSDYLWWVEG